MSGKADREVDPAAAKSALTSPGTYQDGASLRLRVQRDSKRRDTPHYDRGDLTFGFPVEGPTNIIGPVLIKIVEPS